jgi:hypothetical protein
MTNPYPERFAPDDGEWLCCACGKRAAYDRYGIEGDKSRGWDESCMLNSVLVIKGTSQMYERGKEDEVEN